MLPDSLPQSLPELRALIDALDKKLVRLLNQRARVSLAVGALKKQDNLPVWQPQREKELLEALASCAGEALPPEHLKAIYKEILSSSRALQQEETIGFLGPEGTFSHLASRHIFGQSAIVTPFSSIARLVTALQGGKCDYAVIPIENSLYGTVSESFDELLRHDSVQIVGEHIERIQLAALSLDAALLPGASSLPNLSAPSSSQSPDNDPITVFSHPQPLGQCAKWLQKALPTARVIPVESTAAAALKAAATPRSIAIGHEKMGTLNNLPLEVLATNIEDSPNNWTRFFILQLNPQKQLAPRKPLTQPAKVFSAPGDGECLGQSNSLGQVLPSNNKSRSNPSSNKKSTLAFSVVDTPGSLAHVLTVFAKAKANLSKLESRPSQTGTWKYVFFADLNCDLHSSQYRPMLDELADYCHDIRILGVYEASLQKPQTGQ